MFAVYNTNGLSFRSTIDNLYKLNSVEKLSGIHNQVAEGKPQSFTVPSENLYQGPITKKAQAAYKKMTHIDTREPIYQVEQLMCDVVVTVNEETTLQECYEIMVKHKIKQIPVRSLENKLEGIITQKKILDVLINDLDYANHTVNKPVLNFMSTNIITTDPISDIRRVAKVMVDFNFNAMPIVTQKDSIVGIVSRTDILKAVATIPPLQLWA